jgi:hypothetical protein
LTKGKKHHPEGSLVFVWNADSGILNAVKDSLHKWISPETYSCRLCQLTYGFSSEKKAWREFLDSSGRPVFFYYRDTLGAAGISGDLPDSFPIVAGLQNGKWEVLLGAQEMDEVSSLQELIKLLKDRISGV